MTLKVNERLENVDLLRGVAIIFVVFFHYTYHYPTEYLLRTDDWSLPIAKYGWSGVDIFFIVSGYCIALTIIKTSNFLEFSVRRFARIYPAYFFCGITTLVFYSFFDLPDKSIAFFESFFINGFIIKIFNELGLYIYQFTIYNFEIVRLFPNHLPAS